VSSDDHRARGVTYQLLTGDCREVLAGLPAESVDAVVTDPPYALTQIGRSLQLSKNGDGTDRTQQRNYQERGFMGKSWDNAGVAFDPATWAEVLRVTRPGGYLLAFGGTRTWHRLACAVEDGGWRIVDSIHWITGQGFPKGQGQLKPAHEPIVLARKPGPRVLPLQIDAARIGYQDSADRESAHPQGQWTTKQSAHITEPDCGRGLQRLPMGEWPQAAGRWPPNVAFGHAPGCVEAICDEACPVAELARQSGVSSERVRVLQRNGKRQMEGWSLGEPSQGTTYGDTGTAARFFPTFRYCPKAPARERTLPDGTRVSHPTQKPLALMRWLVKLVAAPGATCLDPFAGSGTTGVACLEEGVHFIGIEQDAQYAAEARQRIAAAQPLLVPG
jgi:site-specific DNA-methyltransferase (adenine-specific)